MDASTCTVTYPLPDFDYYNATWPETTVSGASRWCCYSPLMDNEEQVIGAEAEPCEPLPPPLNLYHFTKIRPDEQLAAWLWDNCLHDWDKSKPIDIGIPVWAPLDWLSLSRSLNRVVGLPADGPVHLQRNDVQWYCTWKC